MIVLGPLLWLAATLATGDRLLAWLDPRERSLAFHLSLAFLLGLAGSTLLTFWLNLAGVPLAPWLPAALGLPFLAVAALARRTPRTARRQAATVVLLLLAGFVALPAAKSLWEPMRGWDARAVYGVYTSHLVHERSVRGEGFTEPTRALGHMNYPLLVPLAEWQLAGWIGHMEDQAVMALFPLCELAMLGCVYGALAGRVESPWPELATACAAGVPFLYAVPDGSVPSGYADVPLAALAAGFCALAWDALEDEPAPGPLALLAAGMVFTKRGGLLVAGIGFALLLLLSRRRRQIAQTALAAAALLVPWWLHQSSLTVGPVQNYAGRLYLVAVRQALGALPLLQRVLADTFLRPGHQALFWWAFAAAAPAALRAGAGPRFLALLVLLTAGAVFLFLFRSGIPADHTNQYSWGRYLLAVLPAAAMALGAVAGRRDP